MKLFSLLILFNISIFGQYNFLKILSDTTELKLYDGSGMCLLEKYAAGDVTGGGIFLRMDSAYTENGVHAFGYPYDGLQWVRLPYIGGELSDFNSVTVVTIDSHRVSSDISLENYEKIINTPDADFKIEFNDDAATLGQIYFTSSIDTPNIADNDNIELLFQFNDDSSGLTNWGTIKITAKDVSDESEDSNIELKTFLAGTQTTTLTLSGHTLTLSQSESIDNVTNGTLNLTATTVKATGNLQTTGNLDVTGDVTLSDEINGTLNYRYGGSATISIDNEALGVDTLKLASSKYHSIKVRNIVNASDSIHAISGLVANAYYLFQAVHTDTTVIFIDGGNLKLGGNRSLDASSDILKCWSDGTNLYEVIFTNND